MAVGPYKDKLTGKTYRIIEVDGVGQNVYSPEEQGVPI
tara:strand:- start:180 stop:293 length:114 start_codon:yes stop_codon:yes gene_type:complete